MFKELIISIAIVVSISSLDIFTQNYTKRAVSEMTDGFDYLKQSILDGDTDEMKKRTENITNNWKQKNEKLAYFIEHDELEKVSNSIIEMKSYIETESFTDAIAELEEGIFVLEHIQERNSLSLKNIF